jgi:hypothetical protein
VPRVRPSAFPFTSLPVYVVLVAVPFRATSSLNEQLMRATVGEFFATFGKVPSSVIVSVTTISLSLQANSVEPLQVSN